jgi:hypothetical protein
VQLVIFLPTFNAPCIRPKNDVMERVKKLGIWEQSKQGRRAKTNRVFSSKIFYEITVDFSSHPIFGHMYGALNIDKK